MTSGGEDHSVLRGASCAREGGEASQRREVWRAQRRRAALEHTIAGIFERETCSSSQTESEGCRPNSEGSAVKTLSRILRCGVELTALTPRARVRGFKFALARVLGSGARSLGARAHAAARAIARTRAATSGSSSARQIACISRYARFAGGGLAGSAMWNV